MMSKIPIGIWIQEFIHFLTSKFETKLRVFSEDLSAGLGYIIQLMSNVHPLALIAILSILIFLINKSLIRAGLSFLGLILIWNLGYWQETLETLALVMFSTLLSIAIGLPIGILCAYRKRLYSVVQPILDIMQTIPTFVYLIPTLMLFGLGIAPGVVATIIFSMPAVIKLTYLGISEVPQSLREVAEAFGSTPLQRLMSVEIPHALPAIRAGVSQCVMLSLSMVVIASLVGADGLGKPVVQSLNTVNIAQGFESGLAIVIIAIILDRAVLKRESK